MAETMRFELMVGISHTTLPTSHLKPLGQVSMLIHSTDFPFFCQQKSQKSAIFSKRPFLSSNATGPISDVPFSSSLLSVRKTALFRGCCLSESCFRIHRRSRIRSDAQGLQHFHDLAAAFAIKISGWFIGKDNIGFCNQSAGNRYTLLLTAGKLMR